METQETKPFILLKILRSFPYAFKGIYFLFRNETNSRVHLLAAITAVIAGFYFQIGPIKWVVIILCISLVFAAELFNTAIERTIDLVSPQINPAAGMIKDLSAGAVLVIAIGALLSGAIIFAPYIYRLF